MREHYTSSVPRLAMLLVLVSLVVLGFAAAAMACQFWGIVGSEPVSSFHSYMEEGQMLITLAPLNGSENGWGTLWYVPHPPEGFVFEERHDPRSIYDGEAGQAAYVQALTDAQTAGATLVMAHARAGSGGFADPHPFTYYFLNNAFALQHNGTIYNVSRMEDEVGANFAALDLFAVREHARWYVERYVQQDHWVVDTEYYTMLLIKHLLVAENYYWTALPQHASSNMEYAIQKTLDFVDGDCGYSSCNAAISCSDTIWLVSLNQGNHHVSYWQDSGEPHFEMISTTNRYQPNNNWHNFSSGSAKRIAIGDDNRTIAIPRQLGTPLELRINERAYSTGSQSDPAISTDPKRGTFVVVWATSEESRIKGRWYNQMGLAEEGEFLVNQCSDVQCRTPAIAHSPNGDAILVVWSERPITTRNYSRIKARWFTWSSEDRAWIGGHEFQVNTTTNDDLSHPRVAVGSDDGYVIVWQRTVTSTGESDIRWSAVSPSNSVTDQRINAGWGPSYSPDVTRLMQLGARYVVTWATNSQYHGGLICARSVMNEHLDLGGPVSLDGVHADAKAFKPAVTIHPTAGGGFVVGYYTGRIKALSVTAFENGGFRINQRIEGEDIPRFWPHPDVIVRPGGQVQICYDKYVPGESYDIFVAVSSGETFLPPVQVNEPNATTQMLPVMAVSEAFVCNALAHEDPPHPDLYRELSSTRLFERRRMMVWGSKEQDGDGWAVVGKLHGVPLGGDMVDWYTADPILGGVTDKMLDKKGEKQEGMQGREGGRNIDEEFDDLNNGSQLPKRFELYRPSPNPFNPVTTIRFDLPESSPVRLQVFDLNGRSVATLADEVRAAGTHEVSFDGSQLSSGTYFVRMQSGSFIATQKMLLVK